MKSINIILLILLLPFYACVKENLVYNGDDGAPAVVRLSVAAPQMQGERASKADETEDGTATESQMEDLRVLVFNSKGTLMTNTYFTKAELTNLSNLVVKTYAGQSHIYFVANSVEAINDKLRLVASESDFKNIQAKSSDFNFGLKPRGLTMTGYVEANIQASQMNNINVTLGFLASKLTLSVEDATPDTETVTVLGWEAFDVPNNVYVFPRGSATDGTFADDANNGKLNDEAAWYKTGTIASFDNDIDNKPTQVVYLLESRRGGRVNATLPVEDPDTEGYQKRYPKMDWQDKDPRGKRWFAPERATCFVIHAMHKAGTTSKSVKAYIYLGANMINDYNVRRGIHYKINVKVNGLNDIEIDTNLEQMDAQFVIKHGTNLDMDAHPDFRPITIYAPKGMVTMEVMMPGDSPEKEHTTMDYDNAPVADRWLQISPLNLMYHQVPQKGNSWQQTQNTPGVPFVRAKYIPHKTVRAALASTGGWPALGGEPDDDNVLTYPQATHRMCYKITDIPFTEKNPTFKTLCVYADELKQDGGKRSGRVKITFYPDGGGPATYRIMDLTQTGYINIYADNTEAGLLRLQGSESGTIPVPGSQYRLVVENFEEAAYAMNAGIPIGTATGGLIQTTEVMQWGYPGKTIYADNFDSKFRNGYFLTANAVCLKVTQNGDDLVYDNVGSNYRWLWGNGLYTELGQDKNPITDYAEADYTHTGAPYFYPNSYKHFYHPIYNSNATRHCHEKNRDMNGDGEISPSETEWYLPARDELALLWITNAIEGMHWSSTEGGPYYEDIDADGNPVGDMKQDLNCAVGGGYMPNLVASYTLPVRCVRRIIKRN